MAYNVVKSIGAIEKALYDYNSTRIAICETICEKNEKGECIKDNGKYKFVGDGYSEFSKKWLELLDTEILLNIFPINQKDIADIKEINITCYETLMKHGFIQEDVKVDVKPTNGKASIKELV